ncbi:MAG: citrate lyase subunit alpha [Oscillospiraceae bacterium]|nr:citrate lyase subunit alpha [Oscillospiraceae bacterium]
MVNAVGREMPEKIGSYTVRPFEGTGKAKKVLEPVVSKRRPKLGPEDHNKLCKDLKEAIQKTGLKDGMTISFHHCFREGDMVIAQVLTAIRELGIKHLRFAPSAVVNIKNPSVVSFVEDGTIDRIEASGIRGELGDAVIDGLMEEPVILRPHGARPRAIETGDLQIDVAFIGASSSDEYGNCTGQVGPNACGSLGYAFVDASCAEQVVIVTDNLVEYPCCPTSISQQYVDYVVVVDQIGDPVKIGAGAARMTKNPRDLMIASKAADAIAASRLFKEGFSFQTGAGAISIACTNYLAERMEERGIHASFALGGMTANIIEMFKKGLVRVLECSQSFDAVAARAIAEYPNILEIDNSVYSNPYTKGSMLDKLNFGVLGALEVDTDFNLNILTGMSGEMMGGLGGGPDVADGADISIVTIPVIRGRTPSIVPKVFTCCTPGESVAMVVTEAGIALNPKHKYYEMLKEDFEAAGIKTVSIQYLCDLAISYTGTPKPIETTDKVVAVVEYRDGTVIDVIRQIKR